MKTIAFIFAAMLAACSSSSAPGPNGQEECDRVVSGLCVHLVGCGVAPTQANCMSQMGSSGLDCGAPKFASKNVEPASGDACIAAFDQETCATVNSSSTLPDACNTWAKQFQ